MDKAGFQACYQKLNILMISLFDQFRIFESFMFRIDFPSEAFRSTAPCLQATGCTGIPSRTSTSASSACSPTWRSPAATAARAARSGCCPGPPLGPRAPPWGRGHPLGGKGTQVPDLPSVSDKASEAPRISSIATRGGGPINKWWDGNPPGIA